MPSSLDLRRFVAAASGAAVMLSGVGTVRGQGGSPAQPLPAIIRHVTPFDRWSWAFQQRAYPLDRVPPDASLHAFEGLAAAHRRRAAEILGAGEHWVGVGPAPEYKGQIGRALGTRPVSGRVASVAVDPSDSAHWLIGGADGGVWETADGGTTWIARTDDQPALAIGAIAFASSDASVAYAGTGEGTGYGQLGAGLLRSADGGATWELRAQSQLAGSTFRRIRVDPSNPDTLLAATRLGGAGRDGESLPANPAPLHGIIKSIDGGSTWSARLTGRGCALEVDPSDFTRQFGAIGALDGSLDGEQPNGIYRSTDAGDTWTAVAGPWDGDAGRIELALAPSNPAVLYVSVQDAGLRGGQRGALLGLWVTQDAWSPTPAWKRINTSATDDGSGSYGYCGWDLAFSTKSLQCDYSHVLIVDPGNENTLFAGGIPLFRFDGAHWSEVSHTVSSPDNGIHADQQAFAWAGTRLIVGNDGGLWSTPDSGRTWATHNTNLALTQFYDGSLNPIDPTTALGGAQDNGTSLRSAGSWRLISGSDGAGNAFSDSKPSSDWELSFEYLQIARTRDGGATLSDASSGINDNGEHGAAPFIARLEKCPDEEDVFIGGSDKIWKCTDFFRADQPVWKPNSAVLVGTNGKPVQISALAFARGTACAVYAAGAADGQLQVTADGGRHWSDLDPSDMVPGRYISDLAFDSTDANVLYATVSGFDANTPASPGHVFKSTNALSPSPSWIEATPRLDNGDRLDLPQNTVAIDPSDAGTVYVGADMGVWRSRDGGASWNFMGPDTGMPNVPVYDIQIASQTGGVMAFTNGRGAFVLEPGQALPTPTATPIPVSTPSPGPCVGDCDHQNRVSVGDLILGVDIALGSAPLSQCPAFDINGDQLVAINELTAAVNSALYGCLDPHLTPNASSRVNRRPGLAPIGVQL